MIISVVLPIYNAEEFLKDAIDSILNQTLKDFELILINDGSTDSSLDIINSFDDSRIVIVNQENKGLAKTLNIGLHLAKGKYIARMDADDVAFPTRFEEQIKFLDNNPNVKLLGTAVKLIDKDNRTISIDVPYCGNDFLKKFMKKIGNPFKHPTVIFDREVALKIGGYNEDIGKYFEDYFLWNEISEIGDVEILNKVLLSYRITPGSIMSSVKSTEFSNFILKIINKRNFTNADQLEMNSIKETENTKNNISDVNKIYNERVLSTKKNKINRVFSILKPVLGEEMALLVGSEMKKRRVKKILDKK